jgi:hypothetical protein
VTTDVPDVPDWLLPGNGTDMPAPGAPHADWSQYATGRGMPADMAASLTKDQILLVFDPLGIAARSGAPRLQLHERDPETLAVQRAAAAKPWQRA